MTGKTTHILTRYDADDNEILVSVEIEYSTYRGYAATLEEPGEDAHIKIDNLTNADTGEPIDLDDDEMNECEQAASDDAFESIYDR